MEDAFIIAQKVLAIEVVENDISYPVVGMAVHFAYYLQEIVFRDRFDLYRVVFLKIVAAAETSVPGGESFCAIPDEISVFFKSCGIHFIQQLDHLSVSHLEAPGKNG
jgi:hypothetical protein